MSFEPLSKTDHWGGVPHPYIRIKKHVQKKPDGKAIISGKIYFSGRLISEIAGNDATACMVYSDDDTQQVAFVFNTDRRSKTNYRLTLPQTKGASYGRTVSSIDVVNKLIAYGYPLATRLKVKRDGSFIILLKEVQDK